MQHWSDGSDECNQLKQQFLDVPDDCLRAYIIGRLAYILPDNDADTRIGEWSGGGDSGSSNLCGKAATELADWESELLEDWIHNSLGHGSYAGEYSTSGSVYFSRKLLAINGEGTLRGDALDVVDTQSGLLHVPENLRDVLRQSMQTTELWSSSVDEIRWSTIENSNGGRTVDDWEYVSDIPKLFFDQIFHHFFMLRSGPTPPGTQEFISQFGSKLSELWEECGTSETAILCSVDELPADQTYIRMNIELAEGEENMDLIVMLERPEDGSDEEFVIGLGDYYRENEPY